MALLALLAPAAAPASEVTARAGRPAAHASEATARGSLVIRWQSNPQTCARQGLCGHSGTLSWRPDSLGTGFETFGHGGGAELAFLDRSAIARSSRATASGRRVCVDEPVGPDRLEAFVRRHAKRTRFTFGDDPGFDFARCAGPLPADFQAALPRSAPFSPALLARGGTVDLRGHAAFAAGPFEGTVDSTLTFRLSRPASAGGGAQPAAAARVRRARAGILVLTYAIERIDGEAGYDFAGSPQATCEIFDSCGVAGSVTLGGTATAGTLSIASTRVLPAGSRETLAAALAALRAGHTRVVASASFGSGDELDSEVAAAFPVSERAGFGGDEQCTDTGTFHATGIAATRAVAGLRIALAAGGGEPPDELRTRCPGPVSSDLPGRLATGLLPWAALGEEQPPLALRPEAGFRALAFEGTGRGALDVALRLAGTRVVTG